jgi:sigma-B regulation protein RsbQ
MSSAAEILRRNNVTRLGEGERTLVLAHGFGCDQNMWRFVTPALARDYRIVLFDYVGFGHSDAAAFDPDRYEQLEGYARDLLDVCDALELESVTLVGHSVSAMIGLIAGQQRPELFEHQVMVCPSPCFLNKPPDYQGGFEREDLEELLDLMDKNYIGWAQYLAPLVAGTSADQDIVGELSASFCSTDPLVAKTFARATFFSDCRYLLPYAREPALILQSASDSLAEVYVGEYMHHHIPDSVLRIVPAEGHCLHMTHPDHVIDEIRRYLDGKERDDDIPVDTGA